MNPRGVSSAGALPERCGGAIPGSDRVISGNLPRLIAAHRARASRSAASLCSESVFEGRPGGRGGQEGRTYSQRTQLEAQHARSRGAPLAHVVLDLRARRRRRASMKWGAHGGLARGKGGEWAAADASRGRWRRPHLRTGGSRGASHGGSAADLAGSANSRRHGDPGV